MAAVEVADPASFDVDAFAEFLIGQKDLGSKGFPRFLRVSANLPATGSNKVLKRTLQAQRWHTDDPVHRWVGRGRPQYRLMTADDRAALDAEFARYGREQHA